MAFVPETDLALELSDACFSESIANPSKHFNDFHMRTTTTDLGDAAPVRRDDSRPIVIGDDRCRATVPVPEGMGFCHAIPLEICSRVDDDFKRAKNLWPAPIYLTDAPTLFSVQR
jgi:hypothetical protein